MPANAMLFWGFCFFFLWWAHFFGNIIVVCFCFFFLKKKPNRFWGLCVLKAMWGFFVGFLSQKLSSLRVESGQDPSWPRLGNFSMKQNWCMHKTGVCMSEYLHHSRTVCRASKYSRARWRSDRWSEPFHDSLQDWLTFPGCYMRFLVLGPQHEERWEMKIFPAWRKLGINPDDQLLKKHIADGG